MPSFKLQALLLDIEGTISSIHFVKSVLFPYATQAIPEFLRQQQHLPAVTKLTQDAAREADLNAESIEVIIQQLLDWIQCDLKSTALKAIQGMVWEQGYRDGSYKSHMYPDAYHCLRQWHKQGIPLYIYSSGSIHAQKLFFSYSDFGDLTPWIDGYFDTTTGSKKEPQSYAKIAAAIALANDSILFLSDVSEELDAAQATGLQTCWLTRPNDCPTKPSQRALAPYPSVTSFQEICLEST